MTVQKFVISTEHRISLEIHFSVCVALLFRFYLSFFRNSNRRDVKKLMLEKLLFESHRLKNDNIFILFLYLVLVDSLFGGVVGDDEAEPDDEDDAERNGGNGQPSWSPHAVVKARHQVRPAPEMVKCKFRN
jgi:hypothetical protein